MTNDMVTIQHSFFVQYAHNENQTHNNANQLSASELFCKYCADVSKMIFQLKLLKNNNNNNAGFENILCEKIRCLFV